MPQFGELATGYWLASRFLVQVHEEIVNTISDTGSLVSLTGNMFLHWWCTGSTEVRRAPTLWYVRGSKLDHLHRRSAQAPRSH